MRIIISSNGQRIDTLPQAVVLTLEPCPRCADAHDSLVFRRFHRPPRHLGDTLYWSTCPTTGEPILGQMSNPPQKLNHGLASHAGLAAHA